MPFVCATLTTYSFVQVITSPNAPAWVPTPTSFFTTHMNAFDLLLQILNLSKNEKGIKFSIKLKFLMSAPSYINCTLKSGKFSIFNQILNQKNQFSCGIASNMTDPDSLKFDSSVGQLGGYTSSLHALRRASCCDVQGLKL